MELPRFVCHRYPRRGAAIRKAVILEAPGLRRNAGNDRIEPFSLTPSARVSATIMNSKPRIVFAAVIQNCSQYLPISLDNVERMSRLASDVAYVFIENDSTDNTKNDLKQWGQGRSNFNLINLDGLRDEAPIRTVRLEFLRNTCVEIIKANELMRSFDFLIVLDMDDVGASPLNMDEVSNAIQFLGASPQRAAAFANQQGGYYDVWALRHPELCPGDAWEEVLDYVLKNKTSDEYAYSETMEKRIVSFDVNSPPIEVDSAFGGLGIYKMEFVRNNPNPYLGSKVKILTGDNGALSVARTQVCEHVHFNQGIGHQHGELFIMPKLINATLQGMNARPSFFRTLLF